jgi:hypothetical protein
VTYETVAAVRNSAKSVVNLAVGGHYVLSRVVTLHGGLFTDRSPVDDQTASRFVAMDLLGFTGGVTVGAGRLKGSAGLAYSGGTSGTISLGPSLGGRTGAAELSIRSLTLTYAVSFAF